MTIEEKVTSYETLLHIKTVARLLIQIALELLERANKHDQSKLENPELSTLVEYTPKLATSTYESDEYRQFLQDMKPALDHHYTENRHHPEHYQHGIEDMSLIDILEMLCDWKAATLRHNDGDILKSILLNKERFGISEQLVAILQNTVREWKC